MCTHSIDDLLPHTPLHYAATGEMVKGSYNESEQVFAATTTVYINLLQLYNIAY